MRNTTTGRRLRRRLAPWLLGLAGAWLAFDNGPALVEEWRLRGASAATATVISMEGGRPSRAIRRLWDDAVWGRGRRVVYQFAAADGRSTNEAAFVTHSAADALQGGVVQVRYLQANPSVHRIDGEPGLLLLSFRLMLGLALLMLVVLWLRAARSRSAAQPASSRATA
jgi:hypothetical protein